MKKCIVTIILSLILIVFAKPVSYDTAELVAKNWYKNYSPEKNVTGNIKEYFTTDYNGSTSFYTFIFEEGGWINIAADDVATPILGYSFKSKVSKDYEMNPAYHEWMNGYGREIEYGIKENLINNETLKKWESIKNYNFSFISKSKEIDPLLFENGEDYAWGQWSPYNDLCPIGSPTGCVATAMAQIMRYHQHPFHGNSFSGYNWEYGTYSEYLFENFEQSSFNWKDMPTEFAAPLNETQKRSLASIFYKCGVSVEMQYSPSASGAYSSDAERAFVEYFKYDESANYIISSYFTSLEWENILKNELNSLRPILYSGNSNQPNSGHAWVCDGYKNDGTFHMNWGKDSFYNDWFPLNALTPDDDNYTENQAAIIGIQPREIDFNYSHGLDANSCVPNQLLSYTLYLTEDQNPAFGYEVRLKLKDSSNNILDYPIMLQDNYTTMYSMEISAPELSGSYKYYAEIWSTNLTNNDIILTTSEKDLIVTASNFICDQTLEPSSHNYLPGQELNYEIDLNQSDGSPSTGYDVKYGLKIKNETQFEVENCTESPAGSGIYSVKLNAPDYFENYQIYAYVFSGSDLVYQSEPLDFIVDQEPGIPILISPESREQNVSLHPDFWWEEVEGADSYDFAIYVAGFSQIFYQSGLTEGYFHLDDNILDYDDGYYWVARARISGSYGEWAPLSNFHTRNYLSEPILNYPINNSTNVELTPTFIWDDLDNADFYRLTIATDPHLDDDIASYTDITSNYFQIPMEVLQHSTQYYWSVKGYSSNGDGDYADVFTFRTGGEIPPGAPILLSPQNNSVDISLTPELEWESGDGVALSFSLQLSTDENFTTIIYEKSNIEFNKIVIPVSILENDTQYYWRIRGVNVSGDGEYSLVYNFITTNTSDDPGSVIWVKKLTGIHSIPVFDKNGFIYIESGLNLLKINPETGKTIFTLDDYCHQEDGLSPTISHEGDIIYTIADGDAPNINGDPYNHKYLTAVDLNGNLLWTYAMPFEIAYKPVLDSNGNLYVVLSGGNKIGEDMTYSGKRCVFSIDKNGNLRWEALLEDDAIDLITNASVSAGLVYVATEYSTTNSIQGKIYALNTSNGSINWTKNLGYTDAEPYNPAITSDKIIFSTNDDKLYALNKSTGATISGWPFNSLQYLRATSAVDENGVVYNGSNDDAGIAYAYAINPNGTLKWQKNIIDDFKPSCVLGNNGKVYIASSTNNIFSLDRENGNTEWSINLDRKIYGLTIGPNGYLYISGYSYNSSSELDSLSFYAVRTDATGLLDSDWPNQFHDYQGTCCYDSQSLLYPPNNIVANPISYSEINLIWSDITNDLGYSIYRSNNPDSNFVKIDSVSQNIIEYTDINLNPLTEYFYKLTSFDGVNESSYSMIVSATTENIPAPQNLSSNLIGKNIELAWDNSEKEIKFLADSIFVYRNNKRISSLNGAETTYTDSSLSYGNYSYYLRSFVYPDFESDNSNITSENISDTDIIITSLTPGEFTDSVWVSKDTTITELENIQFRLTGYDPDGEKLLYNWRVDDSSVSNDSTYLFTTSYTSLRNYVVSLDVTDNYDITKNKNTLHFEWNINVTDVNRAPVIVSYLPVEQNIEVPNINPVLNFELSVSDPDIDNNLDFTWFINSINQNISDSLFSHTFTNEGLFEIKALVTDGIAADSVMWNITSFVGIEEINIPKVTQLHQNYPNPFNPETTITYDIAKQSQVSINVLNYKGELITSLVNGSKNPGSYTVKWNCSDSKGQTITSGMYFIVMQTENYSKIVKALMIK